MLNEAIEDATDDVTLFAKVFDEPEANVAAAAMLKEAYDAEGLEWCWQIDIGCQYAERRISPEALERLHELYALLVERQFAMRLRKQPKISIDGSYEPRLEDAE